MRRSGRRIEIWYANISSGEIRKKGPRYGRRWDAAEVVELEIKLEANDDPPKFYLYCTEHRESFENLKLARARIKDLARELADERSKENWKEVILVESSGYDLELRVFGYGFSRVLVSGKRKRRRSGDAYGKSETHWGVLFEIDFDENLWTDLVALSEIENWFDELRGNDRYGSEDKPKGGFDVEVLLRYVRGRGRLLSAIKDGKTVKVPR